MVLKRIPGFSKYFANKKGEIYGPKNIPLKKCIQSSKRYYVVNIYNDKLKKYQSNRVHRLVCLAFHGKPKKNANTVSHLDGDWKNNQPNNLKWENLSDNHQRKKQHGTDDIGIKNSRSLINLKQLKRIRKLLKSNMTQVKISKIMGVSRLFITKIANGHRYKGQGY